MDPLSITAAAGSLAAFCGKAILGIRALKDSWNDAPRSLTSLAAECSTLRASLVVLQTTMQEQQNLMESVSSKPSYLELFGDDGMVTEAMNDIICSCSMGISDLTREIAAIQSHTSSNGFLTLVGRAGFIVDESRLKDLAQSLRGQSGALNTLQTVLQG